MRAWIVRAGAGGEREATALNERMVIAGWPKVGDLSQLKSWDELLEVLARAYPRENHRVLSNWRGQLWRFRMVITEGDLVVLPRKNRELAIGRVIGPYEYRPDAPAWMRHVRKVEWLTTALPRDAARPDLRASLGSLLTVSELRRFDAVNRVAALTETGIDPGSPAVPADVRSLEGPEQLASRLAADPGTPVRMSVRDFIALWGTLSRSRKAIETIRASLAEFGLSTVPPFTEVSIDEEIAVLPVGEAPESGTAEHTAELDLEITEPEDLGPESVEMSTEPDPEGSSIGLTLTVGRIPSARRAVVTVGLDDPITKAIDLMAANDFDQLPVLDPDGHVCGAISWREIGATLRPSSAIIAEAATQLIKAVRTNDPLADCLSTVADHGHVVVLAPNGGLSGIVTRYDLAHRFEAELRPYALLEEVEKRLRRSIAAALRRIKEETGAYPITEAKFQKLTTKGLNFIDYIDLLRQTDVWAATGWMFSQGSFTDRLDRVRTIRNETMHFHETDDDRDTAVAEIRTVLSMLKAVNPQP